MDSYQVEFKRSASQDLTRLSRAQVPRVLAAIDALAVDPFPRQSVKLVGAEHTHRLRVGTYRVIYEVDTKGRIVTIYYVRHRREAYRGR